MIQGALESAFKAFIAGDKLSPDSLDRLACGGILEPTARPVEIPSPPKIISPRRSVVEDTRAQHRTRPIATIQAMSSLLRSRLQLRREGFGRSMARIHARKGTATGQNAMRAMRQSFVEFRAADFQAARCLFPAPRNCLPDSLALLDFLFEVGVAADLVIGVRMDPYGAHCWVQSKEALLNETVDYAASFTPILVV